MTGPAETVAAAGSAFLCPCLNFTLADLERRIAAAPGIGLERVMAETGIGGKCTACLLDLEYHFVELAGRYAGRAAQAANAPGAAPAAAERLGFKQRVYRAIDRLAPPAHPPSWTDYWLPVIRGAGIEQFVWIANRSLMFEGGECAPDMAVSLVVRAADGTPLHAAKHALQRESDLRVRVSHFLPEPPAGALSIGSVRIARRALVPGYRGTTRPQIEIVAADGACCVHGQAPWPTARSAQTFIHRPEDERLFFAVVNATARPMAIHFDYPHPADAADGIGPSDHALTIPGHGAALHEVTLDEAASARLCGRPYATFWRSLDLHKAYLLCADPALRRFSVDHV